MTCAAKLISFAPVMLANRYATPRAECAPSPTGCADCSGSMATSHVTLMESLTCRDRDLAHKPCEGDNGMRCLKNRLVFKNHITTARPVDLDPARLNNTSHRQSAFK